jgi:hypothetical protein
MGILGLESSWWSVICLSSAIVFFADRHALCRWVSMPALAGFAKYNRAQRAKLGWILQRTDAHGRTFTTSNDHARAAGCSAFIYLRIAPMLAGFALGSVGSERVGDYLDHH